MIKNKVGVTRFFDEYNRVRAQLTTKKLERRQSRKALEILDPEKAARKRIKKNVKKKQLRYKRQNIYGDGYERKKGSAGGKKQVAPEIDFSAKDNDDDM